ncbi:MAG: copper amine oxidase N-terminal domain-containing protein [Defluviitaleaceae bacterium]|nr:copper amine oxidase N-terminal domain-containing protein [Defluviitaleaceae bacterium]
MKRKIALFLAVAMILSLLPTTLFAQPEARPGTVSNHIISSTQGRSQLVSPWLSGAGVPTGIPTGELDPWTLRDAAGNGSNGEWRTADLTFVPPTPTGSRLFTGVALPPIFTNQAAAVTNTTPLAAADAPGAIPVLAPFNAPLASSLTGHVVRSETSWSVLGTRTEDQAWSADDVWVHTGWVLRLNTTTDGIIHQGRPTGSDQAAANVDIHIWEPVFVRLQTVAAPAVGTATPFLPYAAWTLANLINLAATDITTYPIRLQFPFANTAWSNAPGASAALAAEQPVRTGYGRVADEVLVSIDLNRILDTVHRTQPGGGVGQAVTFGVELTDGARFPSTPDRRQLPMQRVGTEVGRAINTTVVDNNNILVATLDGASAPIATFVTGPYPFTTGFVTLEFPNGAPPVGVNGWLRFTMPIARVRGNTERLIVRATQFGDTIELLNAPISSVPGRGIDIRYGSVVYFDNQAHLSNVTIAEIAPYALRAGGATMGNRNLANRVQGFRNNAVYNETTLNLPSHIAVRLTAPANYFWSPVTSHNLHVVSPNPRSIWQSGLTAAQTTTFLENGRFNDVFVHDYFRPDNNRHERVIVIPNVGSHSDLHTADLIGQLQLQGLVLIAGAGAPATGAVNIDARVGRLSPHGTATTGACQVTGAVTGAQFNPNFLCFCLLDTCPGTFRCENSNCSSVWSDWNPGVGTYARTLHVATRVAAGLSLDVIGTADFRSGSTVQVGAITHYFSQSDRTVADGRGATNSTATLRIVENVGNALHMGPGHPINFQFPEGIQPMQMRYRLYPTGAPGFGWTEWQTRPATGQGTNPNVRFISDHIISLNHGLPQGRTALRTLEVEFRLSVEAGFEHKYDGDIPVTVTGPGVALLPEADNTAVIGTVWDPITVTLEGGPVAVDFVGRENNIPRTPIGNIIIEETRGGSLAMGDHLWIYVGRQLLPRPWDITLVNEGTVITDNQSGLQVTVTRNHRVLSAGGESIVMQLTVTRAADPDIQGSITLSGNEVFGIVYYDEIYSIVVSGNAVARNHSLVANHNVTGANIVINGVFNTFPYAVRFIENIIPEDGISGGQALSLDGVRFDPVVAIGGITPPVIWERLPGMAHEAGFVAARAFAVTAGVADENINWASGVATISGWNYQGQWVTVILTQNSTTATIVVDGAVGTVDIADFAEGQSGPSGTVAPVFRNNRIYLPFRFLFNAFGYQNDYVLTREGNVAVVRSR